MKIDRRLVRKAILVVIAAIVIAGFASLLFSFIIQTYEDYKLKHECNYYYIGFKQINNTLIIGVSREITSIYDCLKPTPYITLDGENGSIIILHNKTLSNDLIDIIHRLTINGKHIKNYEPVIIIENDLDRASLANYDIIIRACVKR